MFESWIGDCQLISRPVPASALGSVESMATEDAAAALLAASGQEIRLVVYDGDSGQYLFDCGVRELGRVG